MERLAYNAWAKHLASMSASLYDLCFVSAGNLDYIAADAEVNAAAGEAYQAVDALQRLMAAKAEARNQAVAAARGERTE
jgi:hypothetical protein